MRTIGVTKATVSRDDYKRQVHEDRVHPQADNGKEFARHKEIAKGLDVQFFFARPYHSWERGANENTNGLARQYNPKGTDFEDLTDEYIAEVEWKLNHRPGKSLGCLTPLEYFKKIYNFDFGSRCTFSIRSSRDKFNR